MLLSEQAANEAGLECACSHAQDLCLVAEADGNPVWLSVGPLQLIHLGTRAVCQYGVCSTRTCF